MASSTTTDADVWDLFTVPYQHRSAARRTTEPKQVIIDNMVEDFYFEARRKICGIELQTVSKENYETSIDARDKSNSFVFGRQREFSQQFSGSRIKNNQMKFVGSCDLIICAAVIVRQLSRDERHCHSFVTQERNIVLEKTRPKRLENIVLISIPVIPDIRVPDCGKEERLS